MQSLFEYGLYLFLVVNTLLVLIIIIGTIVGWLKTGCSLKKDKELIKYEYTIIRGYILGYTPHVYTCIVLPEEEELRKADIANAAL